MMSVINQALKKAQRQQLAHSMPRLSGHSPLATSVTRQRRRFLHQRGLASGMAVLGGGVLVYAWLSSPSLPQSVPAPTPPQAAMSGPVTPSGALPQIPTTPPGSPGAAPRLPAQSTWQVQEIPQRPGATVVTPEAGGRPPAISGPAVMSNTVSPPVQTSVVPSLPELAAVPNLPESQGRSVSRGTTIPSASTPSAALLEQALRQQAAGDLQQARVLLEHIVERDPSAKGAYNSLGNVYYQQEQYVQAASMYEQALAIDPQYVKARNNLGSTYMRLGRPEQALAELQQALQLDAAYGLTHYNLACFYARMGDGTTAARYLQQAIDREPQARDWAQSDADFSPVRTTPAMQHLLGGVR